MGAPRGIQVIRAQPIKQKNIGDDAIVECVQTAIKQGTEASRLVLITGDKGLVRRMPSGVKWRSPKWLRKEIAHLPEEMELGRPSAPVHSAPDEVDENQAMETSPGSRRWGQGWWDSLRLLPKLLWSSIGSNESRRREEVVRTGFHERSRGKA